MYKTGKRKNRYILPILAASLALAACSSGGNQAEGEDYPGGKPVRLVAGAEPGSGYDVTARALGQVLQEENLLDNSMPIENQPGANGSVWLSEMVQQYEGQDDVLAVSSLAPITNELRGDAELGLKDVTMIASLITEYFVVAVPADSEFKTLDDAIDAIKQNPQEVPVGSAIDDRLPLALLVEDAGGDPKSIDFVAYDGGGEIIASALNGDTEVVLSGVSEFQSQLENGDLRGLGLIRDERLPAPLDDIPTTNEQGYNVDLANWRGIYGPPEMPDYAVNYWQDVIQEALETDSWKKIADRNGWDTTYREGEELQRHLDETYNVMEDGFKAIGQIE